MNPLAMDWLVPALGWALLHFVWQGLVVGAMAAVVLALLRHASPRWRYAVCALALLVCLCLPLTHMGWLLTAADAPASTAFELPTWLQSLSTQLPALVAAWSLGVGLMALRLGAGLAWVGMLRRRAVAAPAVWQARLDALAHTLGVQRTVLLQLLPDLPSPITVGFLRPLVLLPSALLSGMPVHLLEALLAHELAHVRRWDYLVNLLQSVVEALLFFHPVVWWLSGRMRDAREEVADELAAAALDDPQRLAQALHALALQQANPTTSTLALAANGGKLLQRLERLMAPHNTHTSGWKMALPALLLACTSLWVQARNNPPPTPVAAQVAAPTLAAAPTAATPAVAPLAPSTPITPQLLQLPVNAKHALVLEESTGRVVLAKDADAPVPIASITKLVTAMVVLDARPNLQETLRIAQDDVDMLKHSASNVRVGVEMTRLAALKLALMQSENRAAAALARYYPGGTPAFVQAMQTKVRSLGLTRTAFADPTGLSPANVSTATEVARIAVAASRYPEIADITSDKSASVPVNGRLRAVHNTNKLVGGNGWDIELSKTGYTDEAGRCLTMRLKSGSKHFTVVLLDAAGSAQRLRDATRIRSSLAQLAKLKHI
jgi:D-alanyl-D-alanine endopeptidase (penicillin-binding protein 7)